MNPEAAGIVAEGFLKGAFDVFEAMLPVECSHSVSGLLEAGGSMLDELAAAYPLSLGGRIKNRLGSVALLLSVDAAAQLVAMIQESGGEPKAALDDADRALLKEVAEPALGGGVANLMERFGRSVEQLEAVMVEDASAASLLELLGGDPCAVRFSFRVGTLGSEGVFLFSASIESLVPRTMMENSKEDSMDVLGTEAALSPEEMSDILSGFGPPAAAAPPPPRVPQPDNLSMVLDIQLTATARLGRVEMPIGDILNLGPGSIIEVGHLVDEPIELLINDKLIARGDVVVVDEKFGLRITEVISPQARIESMR